MCNNKCFICHKVGCHTNKHPRPGNRVTIRPPPCPASTFICVAAEVPGSEPNLLLDYIWKLNIMKKEAIHSLGIVYGELNQDGTIAESGSAEEVVAYMDYLNRRTASVSVSPSLSIAPIFVAGRESKSIQIPISLIGANHKTAETVALVDCGASGCFVNATLVAHLGWQTT